MKTIVITGRTGVGKSRLLASIRHQTRIALVDPLSVPVRTWATPDPAVCKGVAIDHAYWLEDAKEEVAEILAWCENNDVPLWVAEQNLMDLGSKGVVLPEDAFELHLLHPDESDDSELSDKRVSVTLESGIKFAKQFV